MESVSLNEIRRELKELTKPRLEEVCLALAKHKKEVKELLGYLLFAEHRRTEYLNEVKSEVTAGVMAVDPNQNLYYTKKNLRRLLRQINKHCKFMRDDASEAELRMHFLSKIREAGIPIKRHQLLKNLYAGEVKRIYASLKGIHEDLQSDYLPTLREIENP